MRRNYSGAGESKKLDVLTDTSEDVQEEITNLMKAELEGGRKTGFSPYNKDSQIMFDHRWLLLIGVKK